MSMCPLSKSPIFPEGWKNCASYGFRLVGLDSEAETRLATVDKAPPLGLVLGAEGKGLRQLTKQTCDVVARLDLPGSIQSLNVSNAAAIALAELNRP